ncbi:MAG: AAA family ATPase [Candidatus Woesearchaeota archaeon]|nr:MAG: AAA family ATPase [Candidatus Woesearchaeota archaeon]
MVNLNSEEKIKLEIIKKKISELKNSDYEDIENKFYNSKEFNQYKNNSKQSAKKAISNDLPNLLGIESLFKIIDINDLNFIRSLIISGGPFYDWDQKTHGWGSAALQKYISFLKNTQISNENFDFLIEYSSKLNSFLNNPNGFINEIKKIPISELSILKRRYEGEDSGPVKRLRFKFIDSIIQESEFNLISEFESIKDKNFKLLGPHQNIFNILFTIFYEKEKNKIINLVNSLSEQILNFFPDKSIINFNSANNFLGPNKNGQSNLWVCFFPKIKNKRESCQFSLQINDNNVSFELGFGMEANKNGTLKKINSNNINLNKIKEFIESNYTIFEKENNLLESASLGLQEEDLINNILQKKKQTILYGPPGTGKTYNTKKIIYNWNKGNLLDNDIPRKEIEENYSQLEQQGRVKFITFHQSYAYEEFIEGIKPNLDGDKEISYNLEDGSLKEFSKIAEKNYLNSKIIEEEVNLRKLIDVSFSDLEKEDMIKIPTKKTEISIYEYNDKTIFFEKNNKNRSHSLSINTLSKIFYDPDQNVSKYIKGGLEPYYNAVLNFLNKNLKEIKKESFLIEQEEEKPYFLIIDEINRGNISKIFGELITLLEADKRLGQDNELTIELPYSKEKFGIPPNLYIIATMNTSDKSIANLDIALRRRFVFIEMLPEYNLLKEENQKERFKDEEDKKLVEELYQIVNLQTLLKILNQRIEYLIDKDHMIGHSYFMRVKSIDCLKEVFYNEVIPLLEEYFYGDNYKLNLVLGDLFFDDPKKKKNNSDYVKKIFGRDISDLNNDESIYTLLSKDQIEFKEAILELIKAKIKSETTSELKDE